VFSGFFLGSLLGIVVAGLMIDRGGLVRPFVAGLGLFSAGLAVGGLAPSMEVLIAGRVLQGLGAGAIPAIAYVSIGRALPERLRPRMFATLSTAWVIPGVVGPNIASLVAETLHWRLVFLGLLPLIAVSAALTLPAIASVRAAGGAADGEHAVALDARSRLPLALVLVAGAGLAVAGLTGIGPAPVLAVAAGVMIGGLAFRRLTPAGTLTAHGRMPAAIAMRGLLTFAFFCADVYVPFAFQQVRGTDTLIGGLAYTAATLSWTSGSWIQAHRIERFGLRAFTTAGFATLILGVAGFALVLSPSVPVLVGVLAWTVAGFGMGLSYSTFSLVVLREAAEREQGLATAGLQLSDVLGTSLGTGVGGALIALAIRLGEPIWTGFAAAFAASVAVALIGLALTPRLAASRSGERQIEPILGRSTG
jgi:MFS family permease